MTAVRRHRDPAKRAELLAAAARSFATRAFDEVSMDDIAAEAGVTKGLLFYYFGSKRRCYLAVIADFHEQLLATGDLSSDLAPEELFPQLLDQYLDFAENAEPAYRLIMSGGLGNDAEVRWFVAEQRARYRALFTRVLLPGRAEPPAMRVAFEGFLSFMEGATLDWLGHRNISRAALHTMIMTVAPSALAAAAAVDPLLTDSLEIRRSGWPGEASATE